MLAATASAPLTVARGILNAATRFPTRTAIESVERNLSYAALAARMDRLSYAAAEKLALEPGQVVALLCQNRAEYLEIVAGLSEAGIVVATLNPRLTGKELATIVADCTPALAIVDPDLREQCQALGDAGIRYLALGDEYERLLEEAQPQRISRADEYGAFSICYTSGTTGLPKGVMLPHRSRALVSLASAVEYNCFGPGDRFLALAPMFHGAGFAFALAAVSFGGTCVIHNGSDAESIVARLERGDIHGVFMVPTHFKRIHDLPAERFIGLAERHALRAIISNAAALATRFKELTEARFSAGLLHETYGSTEAGIVTNIRPEDLLRKPESVGTPFPGMEIEIRRDNGELCDCGEVGELFARGPYTFIGYLNRDADTAAALHGDWVSVQDLAVRDEEGFISIVGRAKDMIVTGGINVYPAEVEKVIAADAAVQEVAVVGLPDEEWGERVHAFVVPGAGESPDAERLIGRCRDALSGYKVPRGITVIDELPRSAAGKILKKVLREAHAAD